MHVHFAFPSFMLCTCCTINLNINNRKNNYFQALKKFTLYRYYLKMITEKKMAVYPNENFNFFQGYRSFVCDQLHGSLKEKKKGK